MRRHLWGYCVILGIALLLSAAFGRVIGYDFVRGLGLFGLIALTYIAIRERRERRRAGKRNAE
jgi:hypothetical protein